MDPFIGEVRPLAVKYAPIGYLLCDGSELPVSRYQALFSVIGNAYGGNGQTTFKLPDLRGAVVVSNGQMPGGESYPFAKPGGTATVGLTADTTPTHGHMSQGASIESVSMLTKVPVASNSYLSNVVAKANKDATSGAVGRAYSNTTVNKTLGFNTIAIAGESKAHNNMMPYLVINYCIAYEGVYPQRP